MIFKLKCCVEMNAYQIIYHKYVNVDWKLWVMSTPSLDISYQLMYAVIQNPVSMPHVLMALFKKTPSHAMDSAQLMPLEETEGLFFVKLKTFVFADQK